MGDEIHQLLARHYGLTFTAGDVRPLPSYDDLNFDVAGVYVLKLNLTEDVERLMFESSAMQYLAKSGLSALVAKVVPVVEAGKDTAFNVNVEYKGKQYFMRLLTYIKGEVIAKCEQSTDLLHSWGKCLGQLDLAFSSWKDFPSIAKKEHAWDLKNSVAVYPWIEDVEVIGRKSKLRDAFAFFLRYQKLLKEDTQVRSQVVHNDGNDYNVLVLNDEISGIIDFGDTVHTKLVYNVAIAAFYAALGKDDVSRAFDGAVCLIAGYCSAMPLNKTERVFLFPCMLGRLSHSISSSAHRRKLEPDNAYISITEEVAWKFLEQICSSFESLDAAKVEFDRRMMSPVVIHTEGSE
jgi:Ser/Thr protein kinase RdoA (MazF antagonist)